MPCRQGITSRSNLDMQRTFGKVYLIRYVTRGTFQTLDIHASTFGKMIHIQWGAGLLRNVPTVSLGLTHTCPESHACPEKLMVDFASLGQFQICFTYCTPCRVSYKGLENSCIRVPLKSLLLV